MITLKFGGTSMESAGRILDSADIMISRAEADRSSVIVSAVAGVSNLLQESISACVSGADPDPYVESVWKVHSDIVLDIASSLAGFDADSVFEKLEPLFAEYGRLLSAVQAFGECPLSVHCRIMGAGELLCAPVVAEVLKAKGQDVLLLDSRDLIFTTGNQAEGDADYVKTADALAPYKTDANRNLPRILLLPGVICTWENGKPGLLGRNGSDFSAAITAVSLDASRLEIWTDVDGIFTADPRIVKDAILVKEMSYEEAMELSFFGSKVLHPKTLSPIAARGIEAWSLNSHNPSAPGSRICKGPVAASGPVRGISCLKHTAMVSVSGSGLKGKSGTAARLFAAVSRGGISILLITQSSSEYTISFCVRDSQADAVRDILSREFELEIREHLINPVEIQKNRAVVSIVGDGMKRKRGVAGTFFTSLASGDINIHAIAQGSSERSISAVISGEDGDTAVRIAHRFFFDTDQTIEVFLFGVGTVGSRLLDQIANQQAELLAQKIDIQVKAVGNSRKMIISNEGIDLSSWRDQLASSDTPSSLDTVLEFVRKTKPLNPVFVDCTAAPFLPERYLDIFRGGMHIATPNKQANSMDWPYYRRLRETANLMHRRFLYETNVGAGLPVIDTQQNMFKSGDRLTGFSGIMSGSLSYIFGRVDEGALFSQAVLEAME